MSAQQVAPTRMALQTYKGKLLGAKKGYELLKKKSDALKVCVYTAGLLLGSCRLPMGYTAPAWAAQADEEYSREDVRAS